ncbi:unnamed protein product, partial [Cuscuta epithymum]
MGNHCLQKIRGTGELLLPWLKLLKKKQLLQNHHLSLRNNYSTCISFLTLHNSHLIHLLPLLQPRKDLNSGRMIGSARECDGLYYLEDGLPSSMVAQESPHKLESVSTDQDIMLWHFRMGHPSFFFYLKRLLPKLFINKDPSFFKCEACALAKHHKSSYPSRIYIP